MSLIGPRPLAIQYLPYYTQEEMKRHDVKPGITGLAQVSGRNSLTWEEKFKYDLEYVDNYSLLLDMKILFRTIRCVLSRADIGERGVGIGIDFDIHRQKQNDNQQRT